MVRNFLYMTVAVACVALAFTGCNTSSSNNDDPDKTLATPTGATAIFSDGFGGDLDSDSIWQATYMINVGDFYPHMRITADAAHTGTHSLTTDSSRTALVYNIDPRAESGIIGVQFYIMAKTAGEINFTVQIGQNSGSSGGLSKSFGLGFDPTDSIKCTYYDTHYEMNNGSNDSMLSAIELNRWYKCAVEVDFTGKTIKYYLDDVNVRTLALPTAEMYGIDRLLVFRGMTGSNEVASSDGPKSCYADDIVLYEK